MLMTIGGKTEDASRGAVMVSPSLTLSCTDATADPMMTLPEVSFTMVSACKIGTPLLTRVPKVRVNREIATLLITGPSAGMFSLNLSKMRRPNRVRMRARNAATAIPTQTAVTRKWWAMASLIESTKFVKVGRSLPGNMSLKMSLNLGTTQIMRTARMATATVMTATG